MRSQANQFVYSWFGFVDGNVEFELMNDYKINIFYSEEDGGYIADIPDLEFCSAFGETVAEALAELEIAAAAWLATVQVT